MFVLPASATCHVAPDFICNSVISCQSNSHDERTPCWNQAIWGHDHACREHIQDNDVYRKLVRRRARLCAENQDGRSIARTKI